MKYLLGIIFLLSSFKSVSNEITYFRFSDQTNGDPIEELIINYEQNKFTFDNITLPMAECSKGYSCVLNSEISIVMPIDSKSKYSEWLYGGLRFKVSNILDEYSLVSPSENNSVRFLIQVIENKKVKGYIVYSYTKGIVAFKFKKSRFSNSFKEYYLKSPSGLFAKSIRLNWNN